LAWKDKDMTQRRYHVIFNPNAGTALASGLTTARLRELLQGADLDFEIDDDEGASLSERIAHGLDSAAEVIVAGGGDGTVLAVAESIAGTEKILGILPLGTMNALARDLGLPLDLEGAIAALATSEPRAIDLAEVNGRPFLHNVIIGLVPSIAVGREHIRGKGVLEKLGFVRFMLRRFARAKRIALVLRREDNDPTIERLQTLVVANNSYDQRFGTIMSRRRLDRGTLTVYLIRSLRLPDAVRLALEMFWGRWRDDEVIEFEKVTRLAVDGKRKRALATMDGEVVTLDLPLEFRIRPKSLHVLAPADAPQPAETSAADVSTA
jgi:diacylglycerol kinase family enzyme